MARHAEVQEPIAEAAEAAVGGQDAKHTLHFGGRQRANRTHAPGYLHTHFKQTITHQGQFRGAGSGPRNARTQSRRKLEDGSVVINASLNRGAVEISPYRQHSVV